MKINKLSIHKPKKKDFKNDMFGYYLAGLIDGGGHISTIGHIVISFNIRDIKSAYKLRTKINYGKIRKVQNKNACNFIISNKVGVLYVASLIKDKLKHGTKIKQYNERLVSLFSIEKTSTNTIINWSTPWFSGFFDADGYMRILLIKKQNKSKSEVRLLAQIDQKNNILLKQILEKFGGYLNLRKSQNTYYYSSVSFSTFYKILLYFDRFSLQHDYSYIRYVIFRKAYLLVQNKAHLTNRGFKKIEKYYRTLKKETFEL